MDNIRIEETDGPEEGRRYDMKCRYCKAELEEGELFCSNCGQKVDIVQEETISEEAGVFCPKCGKNFTNGEIFCDNCGTNLTDDHGLEMKDKNIADGKKKGIGHKSKKCTMVIVAIFMAGILGVAIFKITFGISIRETQKDKVLYVKNQNLYMTDVHDLKTQERVCVIPTIENWYNWAPKPWMKGYRLWYRGNKNMISQSFLTEDQKSIFFVKNYNIEKDTFDLYKTKTLKLEDEELQDKGVSFYKVLGNKVLYVKNEVIYYSEGEEKRKFGRGIYDFKVDDGGKSILWTEEKGAGENATYNLYWQDLNQKSEKIKLYSGLNNGEIGEQGDYNKYIYPNKDLSTIILYDKDTVYRITNRGERKELCLADELYEVNADEETFYYRICRKDGKLWELRDFIYDDTNEMTEEDWKQLEIESPSFLGNSLYFYCSGNSRDVSLAFNSWTQSLDGMLIFYEINCDKKISWSEYKKIDKANKRYWGNLVDDKKLAIDGDVVLNLECQGDGSLLLKAGANRILLFSYKLDDYGFSVNRDDKVYIIHTDKEQRGQIEECDLEFDNAIILFSDENGLYYTNDRNKGYGDLYCQNKLLVSGVYEAKYLAPDKILCCTDHDEENGCTYEIFDGEKTKRIGEGVKAIQYMEDGTALMLADYDSDSGTGSLIYYDGKRSVTVEDEVSSFVKRDRRSILIHGWEEDD